MMKLLKKTLYRFFDYPSSDIDSLNIRFAVVHIPDQIGDAMAVFPIIRALEAKKVEHVLIVASEMNRQVFTALTLNHSQLTIESMPFQDIASLDEIKQIALRIRTRYGQPDLCIEAMRKRNVKTLFFINKLRAKVNLEVVNLKMKCFSPVSKAATRMDQTFRAPVPMTWSILMRDAGFPVVSPKFELPLPATVVAEVRQETQAIADYIVFNFEGSIAERTFSRSTCERIIATVQALTSLPIVIVHSPKAEAQAVQLTQLFDNVYCLNLTPSILRSAAAVYDAKLCITPDTSIMHMASAYNVPVLSVYSNYKTRWANLQDISETVVVGDAIDCLDLAEFKQRFSLLMQRIMNHHSMKPDCVH